MKQFLLGKSLSELKDVCAECGMPRFAAQQMADWLYKKKVRNIDDMSNISKDNRAKLAERFEVGHIRPVEILSSTDGTKKYAFPTGNEGQLIESVMIPDRDRATLCVSSQAGCKMGCVFCMTGRQGFHGHLSSREIISQFMNIDESDLLTNAVFMGMGEPLDNWTEVKKAIEVLTSEWGFGWSPKRITLSTIGDLAALKDFLDSTTCHLAISIHNPFAAERACLMPVENRYHISDVLALVRQYDFSGQRRITFEYTMFAGVNDTKRHADALARLLRGLPCRVNLIRFHQIPDSPLRTSAPAVIENFQKRLESCGITTTLRASRGEDILAACGMLAGKNTERH